MEDLKDLTESMYNKSKGISDTAESLGERYHERLVHHLEDMISRINYTIEEIDDIWED